MNLIATPPLSSSSHGPDLAAVVAGHGCVHEIPGSSCWVHAFAQVDAMADASCADVSEEGWAM